MPNNLHKIQKQFLDSILDKSAECDFIKSDDAVERMAIYRATIMENLRKSLSITFPGIWQLLGDNCANAASYFFCKERGNLPSSGCMDFWGERFPGFLGSKKELASLPYLEDYARYEWLKHLSYINPNKSPILESQFDEYDSAQMQNLKITLQDHAFLFQSIHPIDDIEEMLNDPNSKGFTLKEKHVYALITKNKTHWIGQREYMFLTKLQTNIMGEAFFDTFGKYDYFEVTDLFSMLFKNKLITKAYVTEEKYV